MRISKLPPYRLSDFRPQHINLREGELPLLKCPECECWHSVQRSLLTPHYPKPGKRCPGSARRIDFGDLTLEEWREKWGAALVEGDLATRARRSARQFSKPAPPAGQPVHRMSHTAQMSPLERARQAIVRHQGNCKICRGGKRCRMPMVLAQREAGRSGLAALEQALRAVARHRVDCADCQRGQYCPMGYELAERRAWTARTREDVARQQIREQREDENWARGRDQSNARRRASDWRRLEPTVRRTDREREVQGLRGPLLNHALYACTDCRPGHLCGTGRAIQDRLASESGPGLASARVRPPTHHRARRVKPSIGR
ncbi:hypothetical protein [Streptomyces zaehneri]|uniref:hypothetical protein n=1 Tax=Streptomyces zaehneri TaxID=3051180 RepID=UPI0028D859F8|nr:hypothetical protein [Streptomyces sp. DSM 40713]